MFASSEAYCYPKRCRSKLDRDSSTTIEESESDEFLGLDCVSTGQDVACLSELENDSGASLEASETSSSDEDLDLMTNILETLFLISPFFFWGTAMVAMKDVLPKAGPLFVASFRLIPAGVLLVGFAASKGRKLPDSAMAWLTIAVFALVDATCFQGFLAEGLARTPAGLGSVIIDSQPLTVAILAAILFGEKIRPIGALGLIMGVLGLCLLEIPLEAAKSFLFSSDSMTQLSSAASEGSKILLETSQQSSSGFDLWESGEWWMLLSAQSMAVGTVLVRWVCKYNDPIMATGWHMILGGVPLLVLSIQRGDPAISGHIAELSTLDWTSLLYTSLFGSAVSYGVFFYNANRGNLTRLSSLTFLTPMFAAMFGYIYLGETLTLVQLSGAVVTILAIVLVNWRQST